jgi:hypothetical protein
MKKQPDGSLQIVETIRDAKPIKQSWFHKVVWPLTSMHAGRWVYRRLIKRILIALHIL